MGVGMKKLSVLVSLALLLNSLLWSRPLGATLPDSLAPSAQPATGVSSTAQNQPEVRVLEPGKPIERELAGGQQHAYQIPLSAGQYLNVVVEQRGIDVVVALLGPDGRLIITVDSNNEINGPESLSAIADATGVYRLLVYAAEPDAKPGRYEAKLIEVRAATQKDRDLQAERDARPLKFGEPIERELASGQSHAYQITLTAGQYMNVVVEQRGIDVEVMLFGPDGQRLSKADFSGERGREVVRRVAEADATYRLEVRPASKDDDAGRYEVKIAELRAATAEDRDLATAYNESVRLFWGDKSAEAIPFAERVVAIQEKRFGAEHREVATALVLLARLHFFKNEVAKAEPLIQRALAIEEKALGPEHPELVSILNRLAGAYALRGEFAKSESLLQRALAIMEKAFGTEDVHLLPQLDRLGSFYRNRPDFAKAEAIDQRALAIAEKKLGPDHPKLVTVLNELNLLYQMKADSAKAEPLIKRALAIEEKRPEPNQRLIATLLSNLAFIYQAKADYPQAESLFLRALAIIEKESGPEDPQLFLPLNNLAIIYLSKFDFERAEIVLQRALKIGEKTFGAENPGLYLLLNNLGTVYFYKKDYAKAEPLFQRALAMVEKTVGPEYIGVTFPLLNLAVIYRSQGDFARAEPLYQRALAVSEKALGREHPQVAMMLVGLAGLYLAKADYAQAERLSKRALAILEKTYGPEHINVARTLPFLAELSRLQGDLPQAIALMTRLNEITERLITRTLSSGSEQQKLTFLAGLSTQTDLTIALHTLFAPNNAEARSLALTTLLRSKGRGLEVITDTMAQLRRRATAQDQALLDQLAAARSQLAALTFKAPDNVSPDAYRAQLKQLEAQIEKLETEISTRNAEFRVQTQPITIAAVQSAIPADAALVEFFAYRPVNLEATKLDEVYGKPRYVAYLLRREGEVQWMELGEAKAIDDAIGKLRQALRDQTRQDVKQRARAVDRLVMQPLRPLLGPTRRVFISPDAALNLVPFAALLDEHGQYLITRYSFSYLTSGRDLLRLQVRVSHRQGPMVVADPDFGGEAATGAERKLIHPSKPSAQPASSPMHTFSQFYFPPLPGTATEGAALRTILPQATLLTQRQATKTALKRVASPAILHIATHGFFLADLAVAPADSRSLLSLSNELARGLAPQGASGSAAIQVENPLLRSGLALAGANEHRSDDDGILTALEVSGLDLGGTKLVVLSACDTGVGEVKNGDGVYGLRRALVLAGSESQVMSLWPVSDQATRDLMIAYYTALQQGGGRSEALRQVQLRMLRSQQRDQTGSARILVPKHSSPAPDQRRARDYSHPYYWASFIQSGEWANLEGNR